MPTYLVRYGELGLKSQRVRSRFEQIMLDSIQQGFIRLRKECLLSSDWGHVYLKTGDAQAAEHILSHTFGVVSFSRVEVTTSDILDIRECARDMAARIIPKGSSFAIRGRRTGQHPYTSQEMAASAGEEVLEGLPDREYKVNLTDPEFELFIEVRSKVAYLYTTKIPGPGGLPLGSQGNAVAIIDGANSALACWLMMKRGCRVYLAALEGTEEWVEVLMGWDPSIIREFSVPDNLGKLAHEFIQRYRAEAIIVGSQQGEDFLATIDDRNVPVYHPVIGMDEEEVSKRLKNIIDL